MIIVLYIECYDWPKGQNRNGCKVQNNVSIYEGIELENNVFCGPSCVLLMSLILEHS